MSEPDVGGAEQKPSRLLRYAGAVVIGTLLGVGVLYVLSRFAGSHPGPRPMTAEERRASDLRKLQALDPEFAITEPAGAAAGSAAVEARVETPVCAGGAEDADCLVDALVSKWSVTVTAAGADQGAPLRWQVDSERGGLLTSFLVEEDGAVLLLSPDPGGDMPVLDAGTAQDMPPPAARSKMTWSRPGLRRIFALVSTTPFVPADGQQVGRFATYYAPGGAASSFFATLRSQILADQAGGDGEWALGELRIDVE